ncbi:tricarballylate dehydrogenase [Rhodopseudomonas thermotolerans]|uniref:Tricarballylate dehydrogenase n=2 Tax=Rhodopseudomonas TaxID=1073 RepID=A0A336JN43_9BRAD|nr:tricarballylate dehydrogenase [Rhodopseudomonas pentothenatexigens]REG02662.1 tricarballylate dehydrogenase [Rhodopseudomonas thermotolerans]SSW91135.1 tricarballylate dehydrogenase [Rhodopseudomonas pentothenatexigens]
MAQAHHLDRIDRILLWDVTVIGGGIAGLCAAIAARRGGAAVRLLEAAPRALRGGNARHGRNFRLTHETPLDYVPDRYTADELRAELRSVTGDDTDRALTELLIERAHSITGWLVAHGVHLQLPGTGVMPYSRRTAFPLGGGKAMINALYATADRLGIAISYDSEARSLLRSEGGGWTVSVRSAGADDQIRTRSVVVCAGGAGADPAWLRENFGSAAEGWMVRGTPYADGRLLDLLIAAGGCPIGDAATCHAVPVDARGPQFDGGIVTRITSIPLGLVVDRCGARIDVAGAGVLPTHYAKWGPRIAACPGQIAYLVLDARSLARAAPSALAPITAPTISELAVALQLDPAALQASIDHFNAAPANAAHAIAVPPFAAYPMRPGLTFVHFGIKVDATMRVVRADGSRHDDLFAAGMIMAANVLRRGYLAGLGITLSAVFGQIAGEEAARHVRG